MYWPTTDPTLVTWHCHELYYKILAELLPYRSPAPIDPMDVIISAWMNEPAWDFSERWYRRFDRLPERATYYFDHDQYELTLQELHGRAKRYLIKLHGNPLPKLRYRSLGVLTLEVPRATHYHKIRTNKPQSHRKVRLVDIPYIPLELRTLPKQ